MTPAARRCLQELAADQDCDLTQNGICAYCGTRPVASRVVTELRWSAAVKPIWEGARTYAITEMGRRYLRRPELEQEYYAAVRDQRGAFTIDENDRIVPLPKPSRRARR